jgi:uncharacterized protein
MQHKFRHLDGEYAFNTETVSPPPLPENTSPIIGSMALDISGRCNLGCLYCAETATLPERQSMSTDILYKAVDAVFNQSPKGSGVSIHLGSGEAMLHPDAVQKIGRRARKLAKDQNRPLELYLTTNGTLLNYSIMSWLIDDHWNLKISIDGGIEVHDRYRVDKKGNGTFRKIEQAVRFLSEKIPMRFSTTSVLCHGTDPAQVFYSIASLGVKKIELVPVATPQPSPYALDLDDLLAYRRFIFNYAQRILKGENVPINIHFKKRLQKTLGYGNTRVNCWAGRSFFSAGPDGALYPCFRFIGINRYKMGDLDSGLDPKQVHWFTEQAGRSYEHRKECDECWAAPLCGGPCFACAELMGQVDGSPSPDFCSMIRSESEAAIWLSSVMREQDPPRLLELIGLHLR